MYCSECGAKIKKDAFFCGECGTKVDLKKTKESPQKVRQPMTKEKKTALFMCIFGSL